MRRILIENARHKASLKRGGDHKRITLDDLPERFDDDQVDLLALDEALRKLEFEQPSKAQLVKLRYFAGCTLEETAQILGVSERPPNELGIRTRLAVRTAERPLNYAV